MTFDCAHMLSGYAGDCKNLHGHTYKVQVTVENTEGLYNEMGMIMDFKYLDDIMKEVIKNNFDHAIIFSGQSNRSAAEKSLLEWAKTHDMRHFIIPRKTTAENMSHWIFEQLNSELQHYGIIRGVQCTSVKLWETPKSFAEYSEV